ncbi:MAG: class I SAM-dependent methyltransferase, partial [Anaerolineaceae bacterium]|nr:class I SAM-dependent methyltransferase [Anaerolineaceae bacterium]
MKKTFKELFFEHKSKSTDKWTLYLEEWDRFFSYYREKPISLLEIGVQNGGSLEIWGKYFLNAEKIIGCDIDQKSDQLKFRDNRISVVVGDVNTDKSEGIINKLAYGFDIIIDDGSHQSSEVIQSFSRYFPHLKTDGVYIVEDMHTSYWSNFGGGLNNPLSSISFFKRLADVINFEHWRNKNSRNKVLDNYYKEFNIKLDITDLAQIHSIEFINSLCVIKKSFPDKNTLGKRIVVGMDEPVAVGMQKYNGSFAYDIKADVIDDNELDVFELIARNKNLTA